MMVFEAFLAHLDKFIFCYHNSCSFRYVNANVKFECILALSVNLQKIEREFVNSKKKKKIA